MADGGEGFNRFLPSITLRVNSCARNDGGISNKEGRSEKWVPCQARNDGKEYRISNKECRIKK